MVRKKWNRSFKKYPENPEPQEKTAHYKIARVRCQKRKLKHPGYTLIPFERLGIFENEALLSPQKK